MKLLLYKNFTEFAGKGKYDFNQNQKILTDKINQRKELLVFKSNKKRKRSSK